jgi:GT2 family glycosyltransferase
MAHPKISIIWLNYNSMKILPLVLQSLESIASIDYPNDRFELIVVDNGSTDGSFEKIKEFLEKRSSLRKKMIRLDKNLGFTGGNNVGFKARDQESKYVALLNNDAIPFPESLRDLVECAELRNDIGAVQGVIIDLDSGKVDTAGDMLTELLTGAQIYHGRNPSDVKKTFYVTYASGAYSLYRIESIKKATGFPDKIFYDEMFAYFDDNILGLQLWNTGFKVVSIPRAAALHRISSTFGRISLSKLYLTTRGHCALYETTNARFKPFIRSIYTFYNMIGRALTIATTPKLVKRYRGEADSSIKCRDVAKAIYLGCLHGIKWGRYILKEMNKPIDIYRAPLIKLSPKVVIPWLLGLGSAFGRRIYAEIITREFEKNIHSYIVECI